MDSTRTPSSRPRTKIVCTLGPSTESEQTIEALVESGMSVARLNMSHGTLATHALAIQRVRQASERTGVAVATMVDVPGSKYRTGPLAPGAVELKPGDRVVLTSEDVIGDRGLIGVSPPGIHRDAVIGGRVFLDDGLVELSVTGLDGEEVQCEVLEGGRITERRGVSVPGKAPTHLVPDRRNEEAFRFAAEHDADFVAVSMVTSESDVKRARQVLAKQGATPQIVSKIETAEALDNFESILTASDAIMVARGDMGVEVPLARVPVIQKDLISRSNVAGKPVITATQMMESMVTSPVPTRAEVTDVANAVFDGTDAVMLSGETSVGTHPVQATKAMAQVAMHAEAALPYEAIITEKARQVQEQTDDAISYDACYTAYQLNASVIVAFTESGGTAGRVSKYRPKAPILALTPEARVQRLLVLRWGVTPVTVEALKTVEDFFTEGERQAINASLAESGDLLVLVAGVPIGVTGGTNLLRVMSISGR